MNEQGLEQSLSALMDGEVSELELHRLLKQTNDPQLRERWQRYQLAREAMQGRASMPLVDVSAAVREAIAEDSAAPAAMQVQAVEKPRQLSRWMRMAVAASVTLAVLGGARFYQQLQPVEGAVELAAVPEVQHSRQGNPSLPAAPVVLAGFGGMEGASRDSAAVLSRWQQENLPLYLKSHALKSGMQGTGGALPHARAASLEGR